MQRFTKATTKILPAALLGLVVTGCVTRTVYVVDDRDRTPVSAPAPRAATVNVQVDDVGAAVAYEQDVGIVDESDFYEPLSPYGTWVAYPGYGRVWRPSVAVVGTSFRPYTHGHWENTEWGWTWVDHHPFGWATGHYGRWLYDANYGWVWTPGTVWSPAWVTWRTGGGYVGWSAMPPGAVYGGSYAVYDTSWVFVSNRHFGSAYVGGVLITGSAYRTCYTSTYDRRTTVVVYGRQTYRGPDYDEVRREGQVIHRPLRETERERPVTRPPAGTVIARGRDRDRDPTTDTRSRPRDDDSASRGADRDRDRDDSAGRGRDRDDDRSAGNDRGRDRNDNDDGAGRGRDRDDNDGSSRNPGRDGRDPRDGAAPYIDDRGAPAAIGDRGVDVDGRGSRPNDRDRVGDDDGRDRAPVGSPVRPGRPDGIGDNNARDDVGPRAPTSPGRDDDRGSPVRPGRPDGIGDNDRDAVRPTYPGGRDDDGTASLPRPVVPPTYRGDVGAPEPERPTKRYAEDPSRFPSAGRSVRVPADTRPTAPSVDRSSPSVDRSPAPSGRSPYRAPAPTPGRSPAPSGRAPSSAPAPSAQSAPAPQPSSSTSSKKSDGKKSDSKAKSSSKSKSTAKKR